MGLRASKTAPRTWRTSGCPSPAASGQARGVPTIAINTLDHSRIGIAAQAIGISRARDEASVDYAKMRGYFGKKLAEHEVIAFQIADMRVEIEASKMFDVPGRGPIGRSGRRISQEASMAKVYATEACNAIAARAVQIF